MLVQNEGAPGDKKRTATEGLMWLLRGLDFTAQALRRSLGNKSEELTESFKKAYDGSLKQYHNFVVKGTFSVSFPREYDRYMHLRGKHCQRRVPSSIESLPADFFVGSSLRPLLRLP